MELGLHLWFLVVQESILDFFPVKMGLFWYMYFFVHCVVEYKYTI
jgi:hypothetical protein